MQYENDDAGLMAWAQEWINEHRKQTENPSAGARGRGAEDGAPGEAQGDEGGEGVTGEQQTDGPLVQEPTQYNYGHARNTANVQRQGVAAPTVPTAGRGGNVTVSGHRDHS